jgi:peptide/nickel transport system ATP-binding protein
MNDEVLLDVNGLIVDYGHGRRAFRAVDEVSFQIAVGETVGLVGESGSGKSTIGRAIVGLTPVTGGSISFAGDNITRAGRTQRRTLSKSLQMVFQDPYSSLNPAKTVGATLAEPLLVRPEIAVRERPALVRTALELVGLPPEAALRYPAQFSGGQRQRIAIARALVVSPRLVVCDEPVSALDLSIQAQVINLLADLQSDLGLSYLFVAHNLAVVRHLSQRIVVLYRGRIMESGPASTVYLQPAHPYTRALIASAPVPDPTVTRVRAVDAPALNQAAGAELGADHCPFAARCPYVVDACTKQRPPLTKARNGAVVACIRHDEIPDLPSADPIAAAPPR